MPAKEPFQTITSRCTPMDADRRHNIDTDQIIPARFLKGTVKTGLGKHLFNDWRHLQDDRPNPDFVLNQPGYAAGSCQILLAGENFGCGSSREHAPWALKDYGFRVIIATSFADIFKNNALKNSLLPVALPESAVTALFTAIESDPGLEVTVNLLEQQVTVSVNGFPAAFDIDPFRKTCLLEGVDEIGYSMQYLDAIAAYETTHTTYPVCAG